MLLLVFQSEDRLVEQVKSGSDPALVALCFIGDLLHRVGSIGREAKEVLDRTDMMLDQRRWCDISYRPKDHTRGLAECHAMCSLRRIESEGKGQRLVPETEFLVPWSTI